MTKENILHSEMEIAIKHLEYALMYLKDASAYSDESKAHIALNIGLCAETLNNLSKDVLDGKSIHLIIDKLKDVFVSIWWISRDTFVVDIVENKAFVNHLDIALKIGYWMIRNFQCDEHGTSTRSPNITMNRRDEVANNLSSIYGDIYYVQDRIRSTLYETSDSFVTKELNAIMEELEFISDEVDKTKSLYLRNMRKRS